MQSKHDFFYVSHYRKIDHSYKKYWLIIFVLIRLHRNEMENIFEWYFQPKHDFVLSLAPLEKSIITMENTIDSIRVHQIPSNTDGKYFWGLTLT